MTFRTKGLEDAIEFQRSRVEIAESDKDWNTPKGLEQEQSVLFFLEEYRRLTSELITRKLLVPEDGVQA